MAAVGGVSDLDPLGWEQRMAMKAEARRRAQLEVEAAVEAARRAVEEAAEAAERQADFEAGPPDGCRTCYFWTGSAWPCPYMWWHHSIETGDHMCRHECHAEPLDCAPIAFAAG